MGSKNVGTFRLITKYDVNILFLLWSNIVGNVPDVDLRYTQISELLYAADALLYRFTLKIVTHF